MPRSLVRCAVLFAILVTSTGNVGVAQSSLASPLLSLEDVIKYSKDGIPEDLIITRIKKNNKSFNLNADEIRELTNLGITPTVIKYLMDPSLPPPAPPTPPSPPPPPAVAPVPPPNVSVVPAKNYPPDARASRVPPDSGLYLFVENMPMKTELRLLLGENQGGLPKVLKKGKAIGYLLGRTANTKTSEAAPVFYLRLPEGKPIQEVVLLALSQTKERRELAIGQSLEKQELKAESMRPFDSLEVGPSLFKITPSKNLVKGEYLFLLLGSAEAPKASYGKVYDFSIQEPRK